MSEAELAIEEKLRKKRQEEQQVWQEYLQQRAKAKAKEEDELRKLKERQQRRKAQRAEHERLMLEMRRKQDEARQREFEERKRAEAEAKRQRLEDAEKKRMAMQQAIKQRDEAARRNFIVPRSNSISAASGPAIFGIKDVIKTKEQLAEDKALAMKFRVKPLKVDSMSSAELKKAANELWDQIVQLESDKYDLEEEQRRQEYHLKELTERQKQINKNKAVKMGLEMEDLSGKYPPKVRLASKYERRIDRRTFGEKTQLFNGGYVEIVKKSTDENWESRINQFKETHGDKHVPKWDPSAPRKDVLEPGARAIYEDSDEDENDELVDKIKGYMEQDQQQQEQQSAAAARRRSSASSSIQEQRRRSSAISNVSQKQAAAPPPAPAKAQAKQEEEEEEEEEDEEEYDEDEEEYEEEEEEE